MKFVILLSLLATLAKAETSLITCSGQGLQLKLSVQNKMNSTEVVRATLIDESLDETRSIEMTVQTQILKPGDYYQDKEVRIYQGFSTEEYLNLGFSVSQLLDVNQKFVRFDLNKFGQGQIELGRCEVVP